MRLLKQLSVGMLLLASALSTAQDRLGLALSAAQNQAGPAEANATGGLTGMWRGWYHYPQDGQKPVSFEMVLIQQGALVAGFIKEPNTFGKEPEPYLHAVFKGSYDARTGKLRYVKTYDGTGGQSHDVEYNGASAANGNKFEGKWDIGGLGGDFTLERIAGSRPGPFAGIWIGAYRYPADVDKKPVPFQAVVVHHGKKLTGFIKEPNTFGKRADEPWLHADLKGRFDDQTGILTFTKSYDGTAGETHDVDYSGLPAQNRGKIEGTWTIPDQINGRFTMQKQRLDEKVLDSLK